MRIIRVFSPLLLLLVTASAYADTSFSVPHEFSVATSDKSMMLLGMLFGGMGDVLPGAPNVVGPMFARFNDAMLVLAGILVAYTGFFGVVSMAHEGEFLGKKFNSVWTPIRTVAGMGVLVPMKSGYCVLQLILMWVVLQGVGAADTVWTTAVKYIEVHGIYNNNNTPSSGQGLTPGQAQGQTAYGWILPQASPFSQNMMYSFICMYQTYQHNGGKEKQLMPISIANGNNTSTLNFPIYNADGSVSSANGCGSLTFPDFSNQNSNVSETYQDPNQMAQQAAADAMPDIIDVLSNAAKQYSYCTTDGLQNPNVSCVDGTPISAASMYFADHISQAIDDYMNSHDQGAQDPESNVARTLLNNELDQGWVFAGAFYRELASISPHNIMAQVFDQYHYNMPAATPSGQGFAAGDYSSYLTQIAPPLNKLPTDDVSAHVHFDKIDLGNNVGKAGTAKIFNSAVNSVVGMFVKGIMGTNDGMGSIIDNQDPVVSLQLIGTQIVNVIKSGWVDLFLCMAGVVLGAWAIPTWNPAFGLGMVVMKIATLLFLMMGLFFAAGLMMSVYIPMIPFIIFFFGVIGWLISVVESMLAAPMVALGIVYPDGGHELLGRAAPAVMLLTNVFVRPTLMVFGLIIGMILSYVGVNLLNSAYSFVVSSNSQIGVHGTVMYMGIGPFQWLLYIILYVVIVMVMLNKTYTLIHKMPDQVLRWIGGTHGFGEYSGGFEEVTQKAQGAAGQMQTGANEAFQGSMQGLSDLKSEDIMGGGG